jgi:DNA-binding LacI/PurR family transcriptional regulator
VSTPRFLSIADQVAEYLRSEIQRRRWSDTLPGKHQLAAELGVNNKTVEIALHQLEKSGLLLPQGAGRKRLVNPRRRRGAPNTLRVGIFLNQGAPDQKAVLNIELVHALISAGHTVTYAPKSLSEVHFDVKRISGIVRQTRADAWIIYAGSREVLEWFASQPVPAFAFSGQRTGIDIPAVSPHKPLAVVDATRHLIALGHRRIVLLCRRIARLPKPVVSASMFLDTLRAHRCRVGDYNLPDWDDTDEGFQQCLAQLFRVTPPTALIVDEAPYFIAAMQFLLSRGIRVPGDVSLVCTDDDPAFAHCSPPVACITWDTRPVVRRILQWADYVGRGKSDRRQTTTPAKFVPGGTVAAVPR